jgi:hypothetical protein
MMDLIEPKEFLEVQEILGEEEMAPEAFLLVWVEFRTLATDFRLEFLLTNLLAAHLPASLVRLKDFLLVVLLGSVVLLLEFLVRE